MFDKNDPRASLAWATKQAASDFAGADYAKFYETPPQIKDGNGSTWIARGQNFIIAYSDAADGAVFARDGQIDEWVLLLPDNACGATVVTDTLPTGTTFVSASGTGWICSAIAQVVTCTRAASLAMRGLATAAS